MLTGSETSLDAGWYVVNSDISHEGKIDCNGDVNIILADGYTMTVSNDGGVGIYGASGSTLSIYGQTNGTGTLEVSTSTGNRIGYSKNTRTLKCFRCHFYVPANSGQNEARSFVLDFGEGETTALMLTNSEKRTVNSDIYDLQGRKLDGKPTIKGMYIVNGRKVVLH